MAVPERIDKSQMDRLVAIINGADLALLADKTKFTQERLGQIKDYSVPPTINELYQFCRGSGVSSSYVLDGRLPKVTI